MRVCTAGVSGRPRAIWLSVWLRDHADYHMNVLLSVDGPFKKSEDANQDGEPLPYAPPPAGLFSTVRR